MSMDSSNHLGTFGNLIFLLVLFRFTKIIDLDPRIKIVEITCFTTEKTTPPLPHKLAKH